MVRHVDLFSGVGGFALALRPMVTTVLFCEIDIDAVAVLRKPSLGPNSCAGSSAWKATGTCFSRCLHSLLMRLPYEHLAAH